MRTSKLILCFTFLLLSLVPIEQSNGCQKQVCRRRRAVTDGTIKFKADGCSSAGYPPWVRQVAFCLELPVTIMALRIKSWYGQQYQSCAANGCGTYVSGDKGKDAIEGCVKCWKDSLKGAPLFSNVSREDVEKCMDKYIYAFLNKDLPTVKFENRFRADIDLAAVRPLEYWWSLTVKLPCKPKSFVYWNAYCANSFVEDLRKGDYVLVQNKMITSNQISFFVEFSDVCTFEPEDINIIWNESFPAQSVPQLSSFPSQIPPLKEEEAKIFFDPLAAQRLKQTDGKIPAEWQVARKSARKSRIKRQAPRNRLGVFFPCSVKSFKAADPSMKSFHVSGAGTKFLVDVGNPARKPARNNLALKFMLDYGFEETGCLFGSDEVTIVPDPPETWFEDDTKEKYKRLPSTKRRKGIPCTTCVNMRNDLDCLHKGMRRYCGRGEVCQTEVRRIRNNLQLITKSCKQKEACESETDVLKGGQCRPGEAGSVCRCCCASSMCNSGINPCNL